jgi:hypothetical protein
MNKILADLITLRCFAGKSLKAYHPTVMFGKLGVLKIIKWTVISVLFPIVAWLFHRLFHFNILPVLDITSWILGR